LKAESKARAFLRTLRDAVRGIGGLPRLAQTREQVKYLDREIARLNAARRRAAWHSRSRVGQESQTKASFDFQWEHIQTGRALPSDQSFMSGVDQQLPAMLKAPREWFAGKRVVDVGCGIGRYTYGLLELGAVVNACDQSEAALRRTAELCSAYADRLTLTRIDLLEWDEIADFDVAFSFGVVHHTGNTYLAMENVCRKVKPGGRVFFMIYGVPETLEGLREVNEYEHIASESRDLSFDERKVLLERRFGIERAHGWFDATSPRINDRLTFEEIHDVLTELGFDQIKRVVVARNHQVVAQRTRPA
jgi:SAM-dependent methyltransferase